LAPVCFAHLNAVIFRGFLSVGECHLAFGVANILDLVKPHNRVANVRASVIGSLREKGNANELSGSEFLSAASSLP
jgi:hypothetical protein